MKFEPIKTMLGIVTALIVVIGALFTVEHYFAKAEQVEELQKTDDLIHERLDISILDDQIYQTEQEIYRIKDWQQFEQKTPTPDLSPAEKEILEKREQRLTELKEERSLRIKEYEERRKK